EEVKVHPAHREVVDQLEHPLHRARVEPLLLEELSDRGEDRMEDGRRYDPNGESRGIAVGIQAGGQPRGRRWTVPSAADACRAIPDAPARLPRRLRDQRRHYDEVRQEPVAEASAGIRAPVDLDLVVLQAERLLEGEERQLLPLRRGPDLAPV